MRIFQLTLLAGILAGAGTAAVSAQRQSAPNMDASACQLFTIDEITGAMDRKDFGRARPRQSEPGVSTCFYSGARGSLTVAVNSNNPKKQFDEFKKLLTDSGDKLEPIAGLGDEAFFWGDRLVVRTGSKSLTMWIGESSPATSAKVRAGLTALAKIGVPKLR